MAVWDSWRREVRIGWRTLRRTPSISVPAVLVLALGIGTATALYTVVYAMWLRPLPYPGASRLVSVTTYFPSLKLYALVSPDYGSWQGTRSLGSLGAYNGGNNALELPDATIPVGHAGISGNLLEVLRVRAILGRNIQPADDAPEARRVAMLSEGLWQERFGGDRRVLGRNILLDGAEYTVVGVLPRGFRVPDERRVDVVTPLALGEQFLRHDGTGGGKILHGVARLQPGITLAEARAEMGARLAASRTQDPKFYGSDVSLHLVPLQEYAVGDARAASLALLGAVAILLLIASANVASLLVAHAAGRSREMGIRTALGATAPQIARQLLAEGLVIAGIGVAAGLGVARGLVALASRFAGAMLDRSGTLVMNGDVLAAALAASLLCTLGFSLAPAFPFSRIRVRRVLVAGELGLSVVLLVSAGLLLESMAQLRSIAPGFRTEQVVTASLTLKGTRFASDPRELRREIRERLQRMPGVVSIGFADALPPTDAARITTFSRADRPLPGPFHRGDNVTVRRVDAGFFETLGIPLLQGRGFTETEEAGDGLVAVVNKTLADRYFRGESVLGKRVDGAGLPWKTVTGVAADTRNDGLWNPTRPEIYLPLTGRPARGGGVTQDYGMNLVVRTAGDPARTLAELGASLRAMDRSLLARTRTMNAQWSDLQAAPRFEAMVFTGFGGLALGLACTGLYGVLSHLVVLRRREIGIRMALGARPAAVQALVVREAVILATAGVAMGAAASAGAVRALASLLYHVDPTNWRTPAVAAALLLVAAMGASAAPAWRASRQDPAGMLRAE